MDVKNLIVSNWPMALGGVIGLYVVYKYVGSSSTAAVTPTASSGPTAAQLQYQSASNVLATQTASDQLHANVALAQIDANQQTAMYSTSTGGTVAMANIQATAQNNANGLAVASVHDQLYANVALVNANAPIAISAMDNQTKQFGIATQGNIDMTKAQGAIDIGMTTAQGTAIQNIILANNQVPLATIAATSLANISSINSATQISLADINSQQNILDAQARVIAAQSLEPIAYFNAARDVQISANVNAPKIMAPLVTAPAVAQNTTTAFTGFNPKSDPYYNGMNYSPNTQIISGGNYGSNISTVSGFGGSSFDNYSGGFSTPLLGT